MTDDTPRIAQLPDRERIARAIYETDPFCEGGEYVDGFQVSPGGALSWKQALDRDASEPEVTRRLEPDLLERRGQVVLHVAGGELAK